MFTKLASNASIPLAMGFGGASWGAGIGTIYGWGNQDMSAWQGFKSGIVWGGGLGMGLGVLGLAAAHARYANKRF